MFPLISVVIIARDEGVHIGAIVEAVVRQRVAGAQLEVIVVDDGSSDDTAQQAGRAGAVVMRAAEPGQPGNPARARNIGARQSTGDPIVFLDADCTPAEGWLQGLLAAHAGGATVVGGGIDLAPHLSFVARCDYYSGCYLTHSGRPAGWVPHHPPNNLSVRREAFLSTGGYTERAPLNYTNEERHWQAELRERDHAIWFAPQARVFHRNRPGVRALMLRNYRWAYAAVEAKSETGSTRHAWMFRYPLAPVMLSVPYALLQTGYIIWCWVRVGRLEPILMLPLIALSRVAYAAGLVAGGIDYLRRRRDPSRVSRKEWPSERTE